MHVLKIWHLFFKFVPLFSFKGDYKVTQDKSLNGYHVKKGLCARISIWDHSNFYG